MTASPGPTPADRGGARSADVTATAAPRSLLDLFLTFSWLALQGFGGVLAVAQRELVDRKRWLTRAEFVELYALAQMLPGANVVNLSLILGDRHFGWPGALAAVTGMLLAPTIIVLALAASYNQLAQFPAVSGALRGMGAVAAGLMIAMALKLVITLRGNVMGPVLCALFAIVTGILVAVLRLPLVWVVPSIGLLGWSVARICIARAATRLERT